MTCALAGSLQIVALIEGDTVAVGASGDDAGATGRCAARKVPSVGDTEVVGSSVEDAGSTKDAPPGNVGGEGASGRARKAARPS